MGCGAPEYVATGYITEKVDVYIYGVLLLGLLAGWMFNTPQYRYSPSFLPMSVNTYDEQNWLIEIIDPMLIRNIFLLLHRLPGVASLIWQKIGRQLLMQENNSVNFESVSPP